MRYTTARATGAFFFFHQNTFCSHVANIFVSGLESGPMLGKGSPSELSPTKEFKGCDDSPRSTGGCGNLAGPPVTFA